MNKPLVPHVTEKSFSMIHEEKGAVSAYTFKVPRDLDKDTVRRQIERQHKVHVTAVRMINLPGKVRRFKGTVGHTQPVRKAVVRLKAGERIKDFAPETASEATDQTKS